MDDGIGFLVSLNLLGLTHIWLRFFIRWWGNGAQAKRAPLFFGPTMHVFHMLHYLTFFGLEFLFVFIHFLVFFLVCMTWLVMETEFLRFPLYQLLEKIFISQSKWSKDTKSIPKPPLIILIMMPHHSSRAKIWGRERLGFYESRFNFNFE